MEGAHWFQDSGNDTRVVVLGEIVFKREQVA
jgi:hypothetical protein